MFAPPTAMYTPGAGLRGRLRGGGERKIDLIRQEIS